MTLTAIAKQLGVSTMTIYRRCKKNGVNIDELRADEHGEITTAGAAVIASLFDATADQRAAEQVATGDVTATVTQTVTTDSMTAAVLQAKLDGAQALIDHLTEERDRLREQVNQLTAALEREQLDRQQERQMLTGDSGEPGQRRWRWPWSRR